MEWIVNLNQFSSSTLNLQRWSAHGYERKAASIAPSSKLCWRYPERRDTGRCTAASPPTLSDRFPTPPSWCAPMKWWSTCSAVSAPGMSPSCLKRETVSRWLGRRPFCEEVRTKCQNEDQRKSDLTLMDQQRTNGRKMKKKEGGNPFVTISSPPPPPAPFIRLLEQIEGTTVHRRGKMSRTSKEPLTGKTQKVWHLLNKGYLWRKKILSTIQWP